MKIRKKKNPSANAGDVRDAGLIPRLGRSPGEGNGNSLQYSCLENPMDGEAWQATVLGAAKSRTRLSDFTFTFRLGKLGVGRFCISNRIPGDDDDDGLGTTL